MTEKAAPTSNLDETKKEVEIIASVVTTIGLIAGGAFGLHQYAEKNRGDRIKESLSYMEKLNQKEIREYRHRLGDAFLKKHDEYAAAATAGNDAYKLFVITLVESNNLTTDVYAVAEIYEGLAICIAASLCDEDTGERFLLGTARSFFRGLYPYIEKRRLATKDPTLFANLEKFTARNARPKPKSALPITKSP